MVEWNGIQKKQAHFQIPFLATLVALHFTPVSN